MGAKPTKSEVTRIAPEEKDDVWEDDIPQKHDSMQSLHQRHSAPVNSTVSGLRSAERYSVVKRASNMTDVSSAVEEYDLTAVETGESRQMPEDLVNWFTRRNRETLNGSLAFVPWILQQSYFEGNLEENTIVIHRGYGAVVFSDASGFTALTERLAKKSNGAELLSQCLTAFFTPLIDLIHAYRGDVIKFSGDALMIYFPSVDDKKNVPDLSIPAHGSYDQEEIGPQATAALRAAACCIEIQKRLHMFDTGVDGVRLGLHIGVGCGDVAILQVGGVIPPESHVPRCEYIISGQPLEQISIAEPLAQNGCTVLSTEAWNHVKDCVIEGQVLEDRKDFHLLHRLDEFKYTFPTIKYTAQETDIRRTHQFRLSELSIIRRFIPASVFKQIQGGTLQYVNEMRNVATMFISVSGVDVSTKQGSATAQELMSSIQTCCYAHEGTLNKFLIDDKGMLFLCVYGLPPLVHTDDSTRAVLSSFDMVKVFQRMKLGARFGITTGRSYCGTCGCADRMEYTVLGNNVNLAARLMAKAPLNGVLCDETTKNNCSGEANFAALEAIKVKGMENLIAIYRPSLAVPARPMGLGPDGKIWFPWYERPYGGMTGGTASDTSGAVASVEAVMRKNVLQICSLSNWEGMKKMKGILGFTEFHSEIHSAHTVVEKGRNFKDPDCIACIPEDSPFQEGGILVIEGATGTGKIELAEHTVMYCACKLGILPIFGSMGPRLGDLERLGVELLRSTLGIYRHVDNSLPADDLQSLVRLLPPDFSKSLNLVREVLGPPQAKESSGEDILQGLLEVVMVLIQLLRKRTPILIVLQLEIGTNIFPKTLDSFKGFWETVSKFHAMAMPDDDANKQSDLYSVVLMVLAKSADKNHRSVKAALRRGWFVRTAGISEEDTVEYAAKHLGVQSRMIPNELRKFITKITLGNVLYIREVLDQMQQQQHIKVQIEPTLKEAVSLEHCPELESINIAAWIRTAMVGETVCLLESLDPLEAAVVKMSTVFQRTFTLPDLASSSCSHWAGATMFDLMRLYRAVKRVVDRNIIEELPPDPDIDLPVYTMKSLLIRKVGASLILEAQRKSVKRQAMMDRVLARELPEKMEEVKKKKQEPHVPWYYENILQKSMEEHGEWAH